MDFLFSVCYFILLFTLSKQQDAPTFQIADQRSKEVSLNPSGEVLTVSDTWDDITCSLTYVATGGTNERWMIQMYRDADATHYRCDIERPGHTSYLYFSSFKMQVKGYVMESYGVYASTGTPLAAIEYSVDFSHSMVESIENMFNHKLCVIHIQVAHPSTVQIPDEVRDRDDL